MRTGLVGALTEHYGSPGRLADYRRQFGKTIRKEGEDPSIFAIALETLAVKAFGDIRIIRDRFVAGHDSCALCRHLDSVPPETPIQDIVDRCRVWESHADTEARRFSKLGPERALPIYTVDEPGCGLDDRMVAAVTVPPAVPDQLEILLRRLLPTSLVAASPPPPPNPRSWKVCYSDYWRECRHRRPLRHPRTGLPTWRLRCSGCFRVYRLRIRRRDRATFIGTGLQWCVSPAASRGTEWAGVPNCMSGQLRQMILRWRLSNIRRLRIPVFQRPVSIWTPSVPNVLDQVIVIRRWRRSGLTG